MSILRIIAVSAAVRVLLLTSSASKAMLLKLGDVAHVSDLYHVFRQNGTSKCSNLCHFYCCFLACHIDCRFNCFARRECTPEDFVRIRSVQTKINSFLWQRLLPRWLLWYYSDWPVHHAVVDSSEQWLQFRLGISQFRGWLAVLGRNGLDGFCWVHGPVVESQIIHR